MKIDIPVFGMVKDEFHKTRALCTETDEISIAREQAVYGLIFRIQEEVHRYTVSRMTNAKSKSVKRSSLEKITGIGQTKAKALLLHFGSIGAIKNASLEEIFALKGITRRDAENIFKYYHNGE
jgi:excinuclease ABC subunit C